MTFEREMLEHLERLVNREIPVIEVCPDLMVRPVHQDNQEPLFPEKWDGKVKKELLVQLVSVDQKVRRVSLSKLISEISLVLRVNGGHKEELEFRVSQVLLVLMEKMVSMDSQENADHLVNKDHEVYLENRSQERLDRKVPEVSQV